MNIKFDFLHAKAEQQAFAKDANFTNFRALLASILVDEHGKRLPEELIEKLSLKDLLVIHRQLKSEKERLKAVLKGRYRGNKN